MKGPMFNLRPGTLACLCAKSFKLCPFCVTLWTIACHTLLSMGLSRQGEWSGLPCPPPANLPNPEVEPMSHVSSIGRQVLYH